MLIKTTNRADALHAIINVWLKDPRVYCDWCNNDYNEKLYPCCESPSINNNMGFTKKLVQENKHIQDSRKNKFASTKNKSLRWAVRLPVDLYHTLNGYCKQNNETGLINPDYDAVWFAKHFKMFAIPEEI